MDITTARLAYAGIAGPIWFTLLVIVQTVLQPDYDQVALPISALAAWPYGWVQNLNFFVFGPLMIAYAVGLHRGIRSARGGWIGVGLLILSGVGLVIAGLFPWRRVDGVLVESTGHIVGAVLSFLGAGLGLIAISRRMAADLDWQRVAGYALASGVTIVLLFAALGALAIPDDAPLHRSAGLLQRIVLVVWFPCTILLAVRLRQVSTRGR